MYNIHTTFTKIRQRILENNETAKEAKEKIVKREKECEEWKRLWKEHKYAEVRSIESNMTRDTHPFFYTKDGKAFIATYEQFGFAPTEEQIRKLGEEDVCEYVHELSKELEKEHAKINRPAVRLLLQAIYLYVWYFLPEEEWSEEMVKRLLQEVIVNEQDRNFQSHFDRRLQRISVGAAENMEPNPPDHICTKSFELFKEISIKDRRETVGYAKLLLYQDELYWNEQS